MKRNAIVVMAGLVLGLAAVPGWGAERAGSTRASKDAAYRSERAVIVVTGMRVNEDPANYRRDPSVGEGATVRVTSRDGTVREKRTAPLAAGGRKAGVGHFAAEFEVDLDATYAIEMTFRDGTVVRIGDYRLPREWKTHFYFHGTTGTLSPASILRYVEDPATRQRCCVYAVYPPEVRSEPRAPRAP